MINKIFNHLRFGVIKFFKNDDSESLLPHLCFCLTLSKARKYKEFLTQFEMVVLNEQMECIKRVLFEDSSTAIDYIHTIRSGKINKPKHCLFLDLGILPFNAYNIEKDDHRIVPIKDIIVQHGHSFLYGELYS